MSTHKEPLKVTGITVEDVLTHPDPEEVWQGLLPSTLRRFGVITSDTATYFPYCKHGGVSGYKLRMNEADHQDRFRALGDIAGAELFGQRLCSGKGDLVITEGEKDCMSAWQILTVDSVSIPTGASKDKQGNGIIHKGVLAQKDFLEAHERIYLCLDQDEPGQAVAEALALWLGPKCHIVKFAEKDVNEMLQGGYGEDFEYAVDASKPYRPQRILSSEDIRLELLTPQQQGLPYPWPTLTRLTGGIHFGEYALTGWGAGVKVGKTEAQMELTRWLVEELGEKVGLFYLENTVRSTSRIVGGKMLNIPDLKRQETIEEPVVEQIMQRFDNKVFIYSNKGEKDWSTVRDAIRWLAISEGVRVFFIDPLTCLIDGDASVANGQLMDMLNDMGSLTDELGIHINYASHLNPPRTGLSHEEGGRVLPIQFTGSRAMIRYSSTVIGVSRNIMAQDEIMKNTSTFQVLLNRWSGDTGEFPVFYDKATGGYLENPLKLGGGMQV